MEAEQIKIADEIISNLQKFRGTLTWDDCVEKLSTFPPKLPTDIMLVYERLKQQDLFVINEKNDLMLITAKGEKAARMGYENYCREELINQKRLIEKTKWVIYGTKYSMVASSISLIISIITFALYISGYLSR